MKKQYRVISIVLALLSILTIVSGCNNDALSVSKSKAQKALNAYQDEFGNNSVADGSIIIYFDGTNRYYYKVENGKIGEENSKYGLETRATQTAVNNSTFEFIPENVTIYLEVGSIMPETFPKEQALKTAQSMLELYQCPIGSDNEPRVMPDEAIFDIEINGEHYYVMCVDDAIKDESAEYKDLIDSDKYVMDTDDYFNLAVNLYLKLDESNYEAQAQTLAAQAIDLYQTPEDRESEAPVLPDEAIIAVKYEGTTYYFMTENGAIKDQSKDYKKLVKSDDYEKSDMELGEGITLYLKKTK